jgi:uncharacterized membrane protein YdfJ with MMPL/SSD domain
MFARLGRIVARGWIGWLAAWILLFAALRAYAPPLASVTRAGEFDFLPPDVSSRRGQEVLQSAFPAAASGSSVVLVVYRNGEQLRPADRQFVQNVLAARLEALQDPGPTTNPTDTNPPNRPSRPRNDRSWPACERPASAEWVPSSTVMTATPPWWWPS